MSKEDIAKDEPAMTEGELAHSRPVNGEVRISLNSYHELISHSTKAKRQREEFQVAVEAMQKFLTFLRTKDFEFQPIIEEFNSEHPNMTMWVDDTGKVRVNLKE